MPKRYSYRLHPGEAIVLGDTEDFLAIADLLESMTQFKDDYTPEQMRQWQSSAEWVRDWVKRTGQPYEEHE